MLNSNYTRNEIILAVNSYLHISACLDAASCLNSIEQQNTVPSCSLYCSWSKRYFTSEFGVQSKIIRFL